MSSPAPLRRFSPEEFAALLDAAKVRAVAARAEAIDAAWAAAVAGARRRARFVREGLGSAYCAIAARIRAATPVPGRMG